MEKVKITFGNQTIEVDKNTSYLDISRQSKWKNTALAVKKNNELFPLSAKASTDEVIEFVDVTSIEGAKMYKAAVKFILEVALKTVFKGSEIEYLHSVPGGMLSEIKYERTLASEDIGELKREMASIIDEDLEFKRYNILKKEAIDFYEATAYYEKAINAKTCDDILTIYKLKDYLNYYYVAMPYSTGCIKKFELKYLGNNRLVILYPSNLTGGVLPEYVHHENIINAYYEGKSWLKKLNTPYTADLNNLVSERKIKDFIESCEDISDCNVSFKDSDIVEGYLTSAGGPYKIDLIVSDKYNNSVNVQGELYVSNNEIRYYTSCSSKATELNNYNATKTVTDLLPLGYVDAGLSYIGFSRRIYTYVFNDKNEYNEVVKDKNYLISFDNISGLAFYDDKNLTLKISTDLSLDTLNNDFGGTFPIAYSSFNTYYKDLGYSCSNSSAQ